MENLFQDRLPRTRTSKLRQAAPRSHGDETVKQGDVMWIGWCAWTCSVFFHPAPPTLFRRRKRLSSRCGLSQCRIGRSGGSKDRHGQCSRNVGPDLPAQLLEGLDAEGGEVVGGCSGGLEHVSHPQLLGSCVLSLPRSCVCVRTRTAAGLHRARHAALNCRSRGLTEVMAINHELNSTYTVGRQIVIFLQIFIS